jgi:hypothetical protein
MGAERAIPPPPPPPPNDDDDDDDDDAMGGVGGGGWWGGWWWLDSLVLDAMVDVGSMSMSVSMQFGVEVQRIWRKWRDESSSATKMAGRGKTVARKWRFVAKMAGARSENVAKNNHMPKMAGRGRINHRSIDRRPRCY